MIQKHKIILLFTIMVLSINNLLAKASDPLPSWNNTKVKETIINFVTKIIDKSSPNFVVKENRIATFDSDGTCWAEKPMFNHFLIVSAYMKTQIKANPSLAKREPYKSIVTGNKNYFKNLLKSSEFNDIMYQLLGVPFGGLTDKEYTAWVNDYAKKFRHPTLKTTLKGTTYQPIQELMRYLKSNGFRIYLATADEAKFLQPLSKDLYGIPAQRVLGSAIRSNFITNKDGSTRFVRSYETQYFNNANEKARLIKRNLGMKPTIAVGNSNGDLQMLQYASSTGGLALWIHHTDKKREFLYGDDDKIAPLAKSSKINEVSIKRDWKIIFTKN